MKIIARKPFNLYFLFIFFISHWKPITTNSASIKGDNTSNPKPTATLSNHVSFTHLTLSGLLFFLIIFYSKSPIILFRLFLFCLGTLRREGKDGVDCEALAVVWTSSVVNLREPLLLPYPFR